MTNVEQPIPVPQVATHLTPRPRWLKPLFIAIGVIVVVGVASAIILWGIFYKHWDSPFITGLANTFPIPAARMDGKTIYYRQYLKDVRSIEKFLASDEAKKAGQSRTITDDDRKISLDRLLVEAALEELATARNVKTTDDQIQAVMNELNGTASSTAEIEANLQKTFGWSLEDERQHIARPLLLTRLMTGPYAADHGGDSGALQQYIEERIQRPDVVRYIKF